VQLQKNDRSSEKNEMEPLKQQIVPLLRSNQTDCCPGPQAPLQVPTEVADGTC